MADGAVSAALPGWYTLEPEPHLLGSRCTACGSYFFPRLSSFCRNPACDSSSFAEVRLSRTGRIWSYTDACYQPPPPYVSAEPYQPFAIAAVELAAERMIILGQVVAGVGVAQLKIGMPMELVLETLYRADGADQVVWKWRPLGQSA
jgi:uncharacterized OB-fold protein